MKIDFKKILIALLLISAVSTVLPLPASKENLLGYYSHCTFTPWSTAILILTALCIFFYSKKVIKNA